MKKIFAVIRFQIEGIHFYKDATGEEEFLKYPHRHIFHIEIKIQQFHDDRDIEFIAFKRWVIKDFNSEFSFKSCEMIADDLHEKIIRQYPGREIEISVFEDGENGSITSWTTNFIYDDH